MRKIITFMGLNPQPTAYEWDGETYQAQAFPQVLQERFGPEYDQMLVFVTPDARQDSLHLLKPEGDPRIVRVEIPTPKTEADYWTVFERLTEQVEKDDRVIFDITHGFRSVPFLVFLAAAYLKVAKDVTIEGIYYGAREMGQRSQKKDAEPRAPAPAPEPGQPAPVIDLSPFASLLDWLAATDQFVRTGSAAYLATVLRGDRPVGRSSVRNLAKSLEELSLALMLGYPLEAMKRADAFKRELENASAGVETLPAPFRVLLDRLRGEYAARALARPEDDVRRNLQIQLDLLQWYVENKQIVQAMALAREWVVSALAWKGTGTLVLERSEREQWERAVNGIAREKRRDEGDKDDSTPAETRLSPKQAQAVARLWNKLGNLRNDLAHAGMKESPTKPETIVRSAAEIQGQVRALAEALGICDPCPGADSDRRAK